MSKIEVDAIDKQSGSTLTLGGSGTAVTLACGATQTGFGRTGTVDWQTGSIKTATFTAANGEGYFADTSSSAFTMNLPAGTAGAIVSVADYAGTWQTNSLTVSPNGTDKIGGVNADVILTTEGQSVTFIFVNSTQGWINTMDSTSNVRGNPFVEATGGTITTSGNCKIHTFTGPGTFAVTNIASCATQNIMSHVIVAGGGGGTAGNPGSGGGGGAGGFREVKNPVTPYTASPLDGYPSAPNRVTLTVQSYPIVVGGGGTGGNASAPGNPDRTGGKGNNSSFGGVVSAAGGGGRINSCIPTCIANGGSGGGSPHPAHAAGSGNTPPTTPAQGTDGAPGAPGTDGKDAAGGGGGATVAGTAGSNPGPGGPGGAGATTSINATPTAYAGGGGGGKRNCTSDGPAGSGGTGGGGNGSLGSPGSPTAGGTNTGGGGGGGSYGPQPGNNGSNGGSGIVIIRYKFQ
jgi:hypothetical protein